jgi:AI-2 transport protein TqsA
VESRRSGPGASWSVPRGFIVLLGAAGGVVVVAGLRATADIVGPVFLALVLTIAAAPLGRLLRRIGLPGWLATLCTLLAVYLVLVALAAALALSVARLATLLPEYSEQFSDLVDNLRSWLTDRGVGADQESAALSGLDLGRLVGFLGDILSGLLGLSSNLLLILALLFFMALDAVRFPERLADASGERPDVVAALAGFARGTCRYLVVSTVFGLIVAVIDTGTLVFLGVPLPLLWGLLAFITNYIPNIGFVIGLVPPALLGLLDGGVGTMLAVIAAYSVINVVIQSVIQPKVVGDAVGLSVTLTFVSLIFWAWVLGPLGALLAIPLSLLAKALLLDVDPSTRWLGALVGGDEPKRAGGPAELEAAAEPAAGPDVEPDAEPGAEPRSAQP